MPFSNVEQITPVMQAVLRVRPERMLDVGCGLGVYGMLSRIQLDLYFDEAFYTKLYRDQRAARRWQGVRIDAIEGFADYLDYIPDWVYDDVRIEDARTALPSIPDGEYDLCLALAVIEHLTKTEGEELVRQLKRASRVVIIAVPKTVGPQEVPGNPFETHRSRWERDDFVALGATSFLPHSGAWIAVFGDLKRAPKRSPPAEIRMDPTPDLARRASRLDGALEQRRLALDSPSVGERLLSLVARMSRRAH